MPTQQNSDDYDAWNPGLNSSIPAALLEKVSLFQTGVSSVDYATAVELSDFCGLDSMELMRFTPQRLITHVLLVRVTVELYVPDGPNYEDLGLSLRGMVVAIERHTQAHLSAIELACRQQREQIQQLVSKELSEQVFDVAGAHGTDSLDAPEFVAINRWQKVIDSATDDEELDTHVAGALLRVVNAIVRQRGRLMPEPALITTIASNIAANVAASELVEQLLEPIFDQAVKAEGYRRLSYQQAPVVMNVKGASASGKSTIRSQQRQLAEKLGIDWGDFALISPDYWRKHLLDYDSLGDDYKYAAMLTGRELELVDKKLDRYVAGKAATAQVPHMLIDRFRFDSFAIENGRSKDSRLLSRFGQQLFLFFMVTPPAETVVRAWQRGLTTGRYKAVDDLLYHNIEAYTGIPALFLSWVVFKGKDVHFEFLDNDVPKGETPKTVAFGWNNTLTILDPHVLLNIDRYREVNVDAKCSDEVLSTAATTQFEPAKFITECIRTVDVVNFADPDSAQIYARFENSMLIELDGAYHCNKCPEIIQWLTNISAKKAETASDEVTAAMDVDRERKYTLGNWLETGPGGANQS